MAWRSRPTPRRPPSSSEWPVLGQADTESRKPFLKPNTSHFTRLNRSWPVTAEEEGDDHGPGRGARVGPGRGGRGPERNERRRARGQDLVSLLLREQTMISAGTQGGPRVSIFLQRRKETETFSSGSFVSGWNLALPVRGAPALCFFLFSASGSKVLLQNRPSVWNDDASPRPPSSIGGSGSIAVRRARSPFHGLAGYLFLLGRPRTGDGTHARPSVGQESEVTRAQGAVS